MAKQKQKMMNIEFIRAVCSLGILVYHYSGHAASEFKLMRFYANGKWGGAIVALFFIMSGSMLYLNNKEIPSLRTFYYKRFKSLYPAYYIAFLVFFLFNVFKAKHFFYKEDCSPFTLILTVLGLDGYLNYAIPNYYLLGEWFLGAIVLLYALYPLVRYGIEKKTVKTTVIVTFLYLGVLLYNVFEADLTNLFCCLISFYIGMLLFKYPKVIKSFPVFLASAAVLFFLWFYELPFDLTFPWRSLIDHIMGFCLYITLLWAGELIMKQKILCKIFAWLGALSYPIFLLHHRIINAVLRIYNPIGVKDYLLTLAVILAITLVSSALLNFIVKRLFKSEAYRDFENMILKKPKEKTEIKEQKESV